MNEQLRELGEAGDQLRIGRTKIFELVSSGELASLKIGRRRLIPQSSIDSYIAKLLEDGGTE